MASLLNCAREVIETARDGIGFIALWRCGRSWDVYEFTPEDYNFEENMIQVYDFQFKYISDILRADPHAILLNGYYHNLGDPDSMTISTLAKSLRYQYEGSNFFLHDWTIYESK